MSKIKYKGAELLFTGQYNYPQEKWICDQGCERECGGRRKIHTSITMFTHFAKYVLRKNSTQESRKGWWVILIAKFVLQSHTQHRGLFLQ